MLKAIIARQAPHEVIRLASHRLKASREEIFDALHGILVQRNAPRWIKALTTFGFIQNQPA